MNRHEFSIHAACHQFYIMDSTEEPDAPEDITDEDLRCRIKVGPFAVATYTGRESVVSVSVEVHAAEPECDLAAWDHVAEANLDLPSGCAVIIGCYDSFEGASRIPVSAPGCYRVRIHHVGLDSVSESHYEGTDHYLAALWPSRAQPVAVLKQFTVTA